jgi:hypothetical protein
MDCLFRKAFILLRKWKHVAVVCMLYFYIVMYGEVKPQYNGLSGWQVLSMHTKSVKKHVSSSQDLGTL